MKDENASDRHRYERFELLNILTTPIYMALNP